MEPFYYTKMTKQQQAAYHVIMQGANALADEFQILFQIITQRCHQNMFIGLCHTSTVDAFHIVVVNQCPQNWLYGTTPTLD